MKRAAVILVLALAACRTTSTNPKRAGAKLFDQHCAQCHGAVAQGSRTAPSLTTAHVSERSDAELFAFITNGNLRRGMPSWSRLTEQRRWQIVAYLRAVSVDQSR